MQAAIKLNRKTGIEDNFMEFYDGLLNELSKFDEFVDRAKNDDLSLATVYGMEKSKFILYAMSQQDNKKSCQ